MVSRRRGQKCCGLALLAAATVATWLSVLNLSAFMQPPTTRNSRPRAAAAAAARRQMLLATMLGGAASAGPGASRAYELEANRQATYVEKAKQLNEAADWYLFEIRPLVYPPAGVLEVSDCEAQGDSCPAKAGLNKVVEFYKRPPQSRAVPSFSKPQRDMVIPMKTLATSSVFDPDTSDDLEALSGEFERTTAKFESAARKGELPEVQRLYDKGITELNAFFKKVNAETGLTVDNASYLTVMPLDGNVIENETYWQRRFDKYIVKKKVDATAKGNKTARFYAKTIFGKDAVSWDPRGDRALEFATPEAEER